MNQPTKILVFLALTFVFVVLYGHGVSGFVSGATEDGSALVSTASNTVGGAVDYVSNYFNPRPEPSNSPSLEAMLEKAPAAIEKDIDLRSSTYVAPKSTKNPHH